MLGIDVTGAVAAQGKLQVEIGVLNKEVEQARALAAQSGGEVEWVSGRREAFVTFENIQVCTFDGGNKSNSVSAMKARKATTVKVKSACLFTPLERVKCMVTSISPL